MLHQRLPQRPRTCLWGLGDRSADRGGCGRATAAGTFLLPNASRASRTTHRPLQPPARAERNLLVCNRNSAHRGAGTRRRTSPVRGNTIRGASRLLCYSVAFPALCASATSRAPYRLAWPLSMLVACASVCGDGETPPPRAADVEPGVERPRRSGVERIARPCPAGRAAATARGRRSRRSGLRSCASWADVACHARCRPPLA